MKSMLRNIWIAAAFTGSCLCVHAKWNHPIPGAPRTADGKVNMTGPAPRVNGKPDLSGIWQVEAEPRAPGGLYGLGESPNSKYFRDILSDFKRGEEPLTPLGAELLRRHTQPGVVGPDVFEHICLEDEKDVGRQPGRAGK